MLDVAMQLLAAVVVILMLRRFMTSPVSAGSSPGSAGGEHQKQKTGTGAHGDGSKGDTARPSTSAIVLTVLQLDSTECQLKCIELDVTVGELKQRIAHVLGVPSDDRQQLMSPDREEPLPSSFTILECGLKSGDTLTCVLVPTELSDSDDQFGYDSQEDEDELACRTYDNQLEYWARTPRSGFKFQVINALQRYFASATGQGDFREGGGGAC